MQRGGAGTDVRGNMARDWEQSWGVYIACAAARGGGVLRMTSLYSSKLPRS
jgi:hypothetical protein